MMIVTITHKCKGDYMGKKQWGRRKGKDTEG
jgi:hypothetical protein